MSWKQKRHLVSPSGLSSTHKVKVYVSHVPNFSNCVHAYHVIIIHINNSNYLDMLYRKHVFFTWEKVFYCKILDKNEVNYDEYQKNLESMWNVLLVVNLAKSFIRFVRKQCSLNSR